LPTNLSSDPSLRQWLEREAKAVSKLAHPHICTLHDIGHQDGVDFLVMELVEGETLEHRLTKGPLLPEQTIRFAAQIADCAPQGPQAGYCSSRSQALECHADEIGRQADGLRFGKRVWPSSLGSRTDRDHGRPRS
jgi:serine/threonine protein kinase